MFSDHNKAALEHGWRWFEYHAQQRLTTFRFYLIIMGGVWAAVYALHSAGERAWAALAALTGVIVTVSFMALDLRVSRLAKLGECLMARQEECLRDGTGHAEALVSQGSELNKVGWLGSYRRAFRLIFIWAIFVLLSVTLWEIYPLVRPYFGGAYNS